MIRTRTAPPEPVTTTHVPSGRVWCAAVSSVEDFTEETFRPVLPDTGVGGEPLDDAAVRRVLLCSGKVAYDLIERARTFGGTQGYQAYLTTKVNLGPLVVILLVVFGSLVAAGLPLLLTILGLVASASATTHPPKPAPVSRAPWTPGRDESSVTRASRAGVDTSKSSRRLAWLSAISRPAPATSPDRRASANDRTRAFSVTTWRARPGCASSCGASAGWRWNTRLRMPSPTCRAWTRGRSKRSGRAPGRCPIPPCRIEPPHWSYKWKLERNLLCLH